MSRVVPKAAELVSRVTGVVAAVAAASARRRALAAAGHVKPGGRPPSLEGFLYKSDHRGRNFKWRWLVADGPAAELVWYHSDPAATLAKHGVTEEVTGRLGVSGAAVVSGLTSASAAAADALPAPHALTVTVAGRKLVLCAKE